MEKHIPLDAGGKRDTDMKNTLSDLNNYLFECMERLMDDSLSAEDLDAEIKRSDEIQSVAKNIIDTSALALNAMKHYDNMGRDNNMSIPLLEGK